ncbi:MAG: TonB-dependent receptor [Candidatus Cloacimonetes bacterium]|nr:TonB-dependent receptor [Candidatus Cloacimonadota bacterium]
MKNLTIIMVFLALLTVIDAATVSGYVVSARSGERITYANVMLREIKRGSQTNLDGIFTISGLAAGEYQLQVVCMGYKLLEIKVVIADELDDQHLSLELEREAIRLAGNGVSGTFARQRLDFEQQTQDIQAGKLELKGDLIADLPQAADADVIKAIQILPGVASLNEQSNGLYVRGGTPDQNQVLLDDTDVYNPSHLGGIYSTFNTDAIASVNLYKAGFPCKYGDRLSSVLDIRNKDGNRKEMTGVFRLSMMSGAATVEAPWSFRGQKGSFMASFRRTLYDVFPLDVPDMGFYDGHVKINWDAGMYDKVFFSTYFGEDNYYTKEGEEMDMVWGNNTYTGQWRHIFSSRLYSNFDLSNSRFHFDLKQVFGSDASVTQENRINDITLKGNFHLQADEAHKLEFGFEGKYLDIAFGAATDLDIDTSHYPVLEVPSYQASGYIQDSWSLNDKWTIQPGLRFTWTQAKSEYNPHKDIEDFYRLSPRFSLRRRMPASCSAFFTYGRYYQYMTTANRNDWPMTLWMPIDKSVKPGEADHYVLGWQMQVSDNLSLQLESYYKDLRNQVAINTEVFYEWEDGYYLSDAYNIGDGYSWGGELLLSSQWYGLEGFVSYSYSHTRIKIEGLNINPETGAAEYYFPTHDRTHSLKLMENYYLSRETGKFILGSEVTVGMVYTYGTGQPAQSPEGVYEDMYGIQFLDGYLDNDRLPAYSRLDASLKFLWQMDDWSIEPYFQVVNVMNRENVWTRDWYAVADENDIDLKYKDTSMFGIMPFVGINIMW